MEISTYKSMCDNIGLNEISKKRILSEVLQNVEAEPITCNPVTQENAYEQGNEYVQENEYAQGNVQTQRKVRVFGKKRVVLLAAVIALMSSLTVMAAGYISERMHDQQKVQMGEDGKIMFADSKGDFSEWESGQPTDWEIGNPVAMKVLEGESLEALIDELKIKPYLPVSGAKWNVEEYTVKVQEQVEELENSTSERYYVGVGYRNAEKEEQFVGVALSISHYELAADTTDYSPVTLMPKEGADNYRTYIDAVGREYAFYDAPDPESGEPATYVSFTYSDRYLLNEITREHARDYYVCNMVCQNMSDEEIQFFLDSLVTYTP